MYLFFDTETNGKPLDYKAPMNNVNNWPRVAQLAWAKYSPLGDIIKERSYLIKPDGWVIPKEKFFIDNGMSTERNEMLGEPVASVLSIFIEDMQDCEVLVAHNMTFDYNILGAEMIRAKMRSEKKLLRVCTMESTTNFCALPGGYKGSFKWPKLEELHEKLFGCKFDNAHDAMGDVKATADSFFECLKRGIIKKELWA
jgi:DNA polymerase III epsilon subunit-like protein